MNKYINEFGKECYSGVDESTEMTELVFHLVKEDFPDNNTIQYALHTNIGSLTVVDRLTGFLWRDIETGFRDPSGMFWLAQGNVDVRESGVTTLGEAIDYVKSKSSSKFPIGTYRKKEAVS